MASKLFALATLAFVLVVAVIPTSASEPTGYVTYLGQTDPSHSFVGDTSFVIPADVNSVIITIPSSNAGRYKFSAPGLDNVFTLSTTAYGLNTSKSQISEHTVGGSLDILLRPEVGGITSQLVNTSVRISRTGNTSDTLAGTWTLKNQATNNIDIATGTTTFQVSGLLITDRQTIRFTEIGMEKTSTYFNAWAYADDWGVEYFVSTGSLPQENPVLVFDEPDTNPSRLISWLQRNAVKSGVGDWTVSVDMPDDPNMLSGYIDTLQQRIHSLSASETGGIYGFIIDSVSGFLSIDLGLGIPLGGVLGALIAILLVIALLREFAGG